MPNVSKPSTIFGGRTKESQFMKWWSSNGGRQPSGQLCELRNWSSSNLRGVAATKSINERTLLLTFPFHFAWSATTAYASRIGQILQEYNQIREDDLLAIFLLFEKFLGKMTSGRCCSTRKAHLDVLPKSYNMTIFMTDQQLEEIKGTNLYLTTIRLREQIRNDYLQLVDELFTKHPEHFPLDLFTIENYTWALATVWSRSTDILIENKRVRCIVPLVDMFNTQIDTPPTHGFNSDDGTICVIASKNYEPGEQIYISYGQLSNANLLRLYGFIFTENIYDSVQLFITLNNTAPLFHQKLVILDKLTGLSNGQLNQENSNYYFDLTFDNPLPQALICALKIQFCQNIENLTFLMAKFASEDESALTQNKIIEIIQNQFAPQQNYELNVLRSLEQAIKDMLSQYTGGTISEDEAILQTLLNQQRQSQISNTLENQTALISLRIKEKKILESSLNKLAPYFTMIDVD
eukprot:TRINITY_DN206_c2_g2_i1.p1 TRINITY_DN206_c2_g2~~TRINITY_DN206_c2_g2_i1.p1  ORF type:complete len:487 (+),score=186.68 TRINITY_DN206_c2_g2_i1:71-1462(+)